MKKSFAVIGLILLVAVVLVAAYIFRPPAEASAPIEAVPLATATVPAESPTPALPTETNTPLATEHSGAEPTAVVELEATAEAGTGPGDALAGQVFEIVQADSEVRFSIDEILRGSPTTAVGTTNQVSGQVAVDLENPARSQVGTVLINARTLTTDENFRNRAIQNQILDTGVYEFIVFEATQIQGLPDGIAIGDSVNLTIIGELTIRDITQPASFDTTVTLVAADRLQGTAVASVLRSDYQLVIPSVPSVAEVSDEVILEIDFVAVLQ